MRKYTTSSILHGILRQGCLLLPVMFVKCASIIIHVGLVVAVVVGAVVTTINIVVSAR